MPNQQKIPQFLGELGLNEKEIKIYMSLLTLGRCPVSHIAEESGITRTHVYTIAEQLRERGFVSMIEETGIRMYQAIDHAGLVALISRKREQLSTLEQRITESVSDFEHVRHGRKPSTNVRFFRGKQGVLQIYDEIRRDLTKETTPFEIVTIFSPEKLEATFPGFLENKNLYIDVPPFMAKRDIIHESPIFQKHLAQRAKSKSKYAYKVWPKKWGEFPADTLCWQESIAFIELSEYPSGTIITNKAVADTFRLWFEQLWHSL